MINLKRNSKGVLVEAAGIRTRASSIYTPNQTEIFKISRSKFNDFLTCRRCFYLDRVKALISPSTPGWTLNETTDLLLKKEFDLCREKQIPHRIFGDFGLINVVPFKHPDIDLWRDSLHHGLQHKIENSNILLHGGIDDIWFDKNQQKLIVVEYKSQASSKPVSTETYLSNPYRQSYKVQLDFYMYLLTKMGFDVSQTGYFYVCNANREAQKFDGELQFQETLVPYHCDPNWISYEVSEMTKTLNSHDIPEHHPSCENCAYARQRTLSETGTHI